MLGTTVRFALVLGGVGFACGFFGPIALSPEANQGPLLGIFITGPGGAIAGAILGLTLGLLRVPRRASSAILVAAAVVVASVTLFFSTPEPRYVASVLDAEVAGCRPPASLKQRALDYWTEQVARVTWAKPHANWREQLDQSLAADRGVVLEMRVLRRSALYENRKPWNRGSMVARPWKAGPDEEKKYYASFAGGSCAGYPVGVRTLVLAAGETAREWPPEILPNLLLLQTVSPVPEPYRGLLPR